MMTGTSSSTHLEHMVETCTPQASSTPTRTFLQRHYAHLKCAPCTGLRLAGFVPVILVLAIIVLAYLTAVPATLLPLRTIYPSFVYPLLILFHFIYFNVVANYLLLVFLDPGSPPDSWKAAPPLPPPRQPRPAVPRLPTRIAAAATALAEARQLAEEHRMRVTEEDDSEMENLLTQRRVEGEGEMKSAFRYAHWMRERAYDGSLRYCRVCKAYKPDRSHHCSVCKRCILRMDHHCVFVNNCISFFNHKFFISFVSYAFLGCLFVAIVCFPTFTAIISTPPRSHSFLSGRTWRDVEKVLSGLHKFAAVDDLSVTMKSLTMIGYIVTSAFAFALAIFVGLHFYLVAKGRTTIELYELTDPMRSARVAEYDLGVAKNFRSVFGTAPICWFLPTRAFVEGDGLQWERRIQHDHGDASV